MAKINEYYQKKELMDKLSREIEALEKDQNLKKEFEFQDKLKGLMKEYDKSAKDILQTLTTIDPSVASKVEGSSSSDGRKKRPLKTYKNPHTGEVVKTRGGNHKVLNAWREQYGKEAVNTWAQD